MSRKWLTSALVMIIGVATLYLSLTNRVPPENELQIVTSDTIEKLHASHGDATEQYFEIWLAGNPVKFTYPSDEPQAGLVYGELYKPGKLSGEQIVEFWVDEQEYARSVSVRIWQPSAQIWQVRKGGKVLVSYEEIVAVRGPRMKRQRIEGLAFALAMLVCSLYMARGALHEP